MFSKQRLQEALVKYKAVFADKTWPVEKYKWKAVKCFQDNWNIGAEDFKTMLANALAGTDNLLGSKNSFPADMIIKFSGFAPDEVRNMYADLFDESKDVCNRISNFKHGANLLLEQYGNGDKQHYQHENAISTYLWLMYPNKYYIYKYSEGKAVIDELESDYVLKKGAYSDNIHNFFSLYDDICDELKNDQELKDMLKAKIDDDCYADPELKTLTIDFGFFISRTLHGDKGKNYKDQSQITDADQLNEINGQNTLLETSTQDNPIDGDLDMDAGNSKAEEWYPSTYNPGLSVSEWVNLLQDDGIFNTSSKEIMKRILGYGGEATCKQLSEKYGESANFYNSGSSSLAKRIADKTNCNVFVNENGEKKLWPILYVGKKTTSNTEGVWIWKLRDELSKALAQTDLSDIDLYAKAAPKFWKISHSPKCFKKEEQDLFNSRKVIVVHKDTGCKGGSKVSQGQDFMNTMKKGDFFYLCYGNSIRLLGKVESDEPKQVDEIYDNTTGWYERDYTVIAESKDLSPYTGSQKWWTPNDNSTCILVPNEEVSLFETMILKPYFGISVQEVLDGSCGEHYWFLNANPKMWSMSTMPVGEVQDYTLYNDNGNKRRIFQNFLDAKSGDMVIGYESTPVKKIVALMTIEKESDGERVYFKKLEGLETPIDFLRLKSSSELKEMQYLANPQGSLFKLTKEEYNCIYDMIREENSAPSTKKLDDYTEEDFLKEVYMEKDKYNRLKAVLDRKKNIILQGAPGVGKTFAAKRLAYSILEKVDDDHIEFIQFHQNYSYEDFIMGYKPSENGFELKDGIFYRFCQKAANKPNEKYFFIIDEINRGNLSKIFGELLMLIEADYRREEATLAYNGLKFKVPENLFIIGMMNTADRSLAMIDYALRRRFSFFKMDPGFDTEGFKAYRDSLQNETFNKLIECVVELNKKIAEDKSLGKGFCIGHSYFCKATKETCTKDWMNDIVDFEIVPMLEEYWFDDSSEVDTWKEKFKEVFG